MARDVRREMLHTWNSYKRLAWGHDHLLPVSGGHSEFFDQERPVGLTIVEALDTLYLMELDGELAEGVAWVKENLDFSAVNANVQVFETNIRMVGGLLSGYLATGERALLRHAKQIADILMPCFDRSPTGIPYRFVNPSTGEISGVTNPLAEVGTIITEFGTLSRLTGDRRYHRAARKAMKAVIERRSDLDLLGTEINVETGEWVNDTATVHPPVDSFYEYVWDAWDLFGDTEFRDLYRMLTRAIIKHEATTINGHVWFAQVDKDDAEQVTAEQSELGSFYAAFSARAAIGGSATPTSPRGPRCSTGSRCFPRAMTPRPVPRPRRATSCGPSTSTPVSTCGWSKGRAITRRSGTESSRTTTTCGRRSTPASRTGGPSSTTSPPRP